MMPFPWSRQGGQGAALEDLKGALKHLATREDAQPKVHGRMTDRAIAKALDTVEATDDPTTLALAELVPADVVAVQVGHHHGSDPGGVDARGLLDLSPWISTPGRAPTA